MSESGCVTSVNASNLSIQGNLIVSGETTTINTTNTTIKDTLIELNSGLTGANANDSGILIERGTTGNNAFMGWDESADSFILGTTENVATDTGNLTVAVAPLSCGDITTGKVIVGTDGATAGDVVIDNTNDGEIIWEGATADGNENKLRAADGAGVNTLPASTGTILTTATQVTVAQGGTGATAFTDKGVIISQDTGTDTLSSLALTGNGEIIVGGTSGPAVEAAADVAGTGLDAATGDGTLAINVAAAQTSITSIINSSIAKIGTAADQEYITFGTANEVNTFVNDTERLSVTATGVDVTGALTVSGSYNLASGDIPDNAANTSGTAGGLSATLVVANGGTGATALTDGGILLGSGTGAITAMAVLADGEIIIGDGTTDPVAAALSGDVTMTNAGVVTISAGAVGVERVVYSAIATVPVAQGNVDTNVTVPANGLITDMGFIITTAITATTSNTLTIDFGTSAGGADFVAAVQVNATSAGLALGTSASVLAGNKAVGSGTVFAGFVDGVKLYDTSAEVVNMRLVIGGADLTNADGRIRQFVKYIVIS